MAERKKVFICSPFRGDMEGNARRAAGYCRTAWEKGVLPVAPHDILPRYAFHVIQGKGRDILEKKQGETVDSLDFQKDVSWR